MSGGGGTTTTSSDPWSGQQGALKYLYGDRGAQGLQEREFFPGSTVIPQSEETLGALDAQTQRATYGSPVEWAAQNQLGSTLSGDYLYGGPGFNAAFDAAQRRITPAVQGQFERAGRFGGGLAQEAETKALSDSFAGLYNQERQRQMGGLGFAPSISGLDYRNIGALSAVGQQREAFEREKLGEDIARHDFAQNEPYNRLQFQSGIIQGGFPGGQTTTPYYQNRLAGGIGGAMTGLGAMGGLASMTGGYVPGFAALAPYGMLGAAAPFALGGALLGGLM